MKTRLEWFKTLPCAARKKAFHNLNLVFTYRSTVKSVLSIKYDNLKDCLYASFSFEETKQGFKYWDKMCTYARQ